MKVNNQVDLLVADDHQLLLDGIISLFGAEENIHVKDIATNGKEAMQLAAQRDYDICLLDINMPEGDGITVAKYIREVQPDLKIIVLTTYNDKEIINEILQIGIEGYVLKNSSRQELVNAIRTVAEGNLYFTEEVHKKILEGYTRQLSARKTEVVFTQREKEVLELLAKEYTNDKIASELHISYRTVETHRKNMLQKTGSHNLAGLLKYAFNKHIIS